MTVESLLNLELVRQQWLAPEDGSIYFNTGSCGRKPQIVLDALTQGWAQLNENPTSFTFLNSEPKETARRNAAKLFDVAPKQLLLIPNTTYGMQLILNSFLLAPGDEVITTDIEHGSTNVILRHLEETRGIVVRRHQTEPFKSKPGQESADFTNGILNLITDRTKLVQVSEIDCFTGWRPDLTRLNDELKRAGIPFLVDGAHVPGHVSCHPGKYPLWVGSGHKWLCGPNSTAFVYCDPKYVPSLKPLTLGDKFFTYQLDDLTRFEAQGTTDVARWLGLSAAIKLNLELNPEVIQARQKELVDYLRALIVTVSGAQILTPSGEGEPRDHAPSAMITVMWDKNAVPVADLPAELWSRHKIWVQPDFRWGVQGPAGSGYGMRLSCHISITESDIERLINSLQEIFKA